MLSTNEGELKTIIKERPRSTLKTPTGRFFTVAIAGLSLILATLDGGQTTRMNVVNHGNYADVFLGSVNGRGYGVTLGCPNPSSLFAEKVRFTKDQISNLIQDQLAHGVDTTNPYIQRLNLLRHSATVAQICNASLRGTIFQTPGK